MISRMPVENEHLLKVFPMLGYEVALLPNSAWWKGPISFFECRRPTNITNYKHVQSNGNPWQGPLWRINCQPAAVNLPNGH